MQRGLEVSAAQGPTRASLFDGDLARQKSGKTISTDLVLVEKPPVFGSSDSHPSSPSLVYPWIVTHPVNDLS